MPGSFKDVDEFITTMVRGKRSGHRLVEVVTYLAINDTARTIAVMRGHAETDEYGLLRVPFDRFGQVILQITSGDLQGAEKNVLLFKFAEGVRKSPIALLKIRGEDIEAIIQACARRLLNIVV